MSFKKNYKMYREKDFVQELDKYLKS